MLQENQGVVMGKIVKVAKILPVKQRYNIAFWSVISAVVKIQRWCRRAQKRIKTKDALERLHRFVLGYNFQNCKEHFDADFIPPKEKKEEKVQEKVEREERLRKLKPMKSRTLFFKNRTFRVDTQNRDVLWSTEKRISKNPAALTHGP